LLLSGALLVVVPWHVFFACVFFERLFDVLLFTSYTPTHPHNHNPHRWCIFFFDRALVGAVKATRLFGLPLIIALECFGLAQLDEDRGDIK
jgi:hypothetical protein